MSIGHKHRHTGRGPRRSYRSRFVARLERVSLDDIARQAQPTPLQPQHGAHHYG